MAQTLEHNQVVTQVVPITVPSCDVDVTVIQQLDDEPNDVGGLTAAELKAKFDETNAAVKSYINDELIPAVVGADATEQARAAAEAERVANEIERVSNETTRVNAETTRGNNETARQGAETTRGNNETTRVSNETTRQNNETARQNNEAARQNNEAARQNNEAARVLAEAARENAETGYVAQCATSAEDAANSATAAGNSATAASNSETAAGNSATAASNSATAAGNSARNAATSESNAAASEAAASASKRAAEESASDAGKSALNAGQSEQNAEASAQDAEAWAVGKRGGVNVGESDPAYHNNALYWKEQAQQAAGGGDMLASTYDPQGKAQDIFSYADAKYSKPSGGIPKTDLASAVQTSLGKADSALQRVSKSDVGLGNVDNVKQYSASNPPPYPVTSVNGKTGAVQINVPTVPATTSLIKGDGSGGLVAATRGSDYIASGNIVKQTLVASESTPTENYAINWVYS